MSASRRGVAWRAALLALLLAALLGRTAAGQAGAPGAPVALKGDKAVAAVLAPLQDANARYARQLLGPEDLVARLASAREEIVKLDAQLAQLRADRARIEAYVAAAGTTESVGLLLWRQRAELRTDTALERDLSDRQAEINELQVRLLGFDQQAELLLDLDARVAEQMALLPAGLTPQERDDCAAGFRALLGERARLLAELHDTGKNCFEALLDVEARERVLKEETDSFRDYVTARVLWLRSATPIADIAPGQAATDFWDALRWLVHPKNWAGLVSALVADARSRPWIAACCLLLVGLLVRLRWPMRQRIARAADLVSRNATDSFRHTLDALVASVVLAVAWPTVLWLLSWRLSVCARGGEFEHDVGGALRLVAVQALALACVHKLCRPAGLGEAHFHWPAGVARSLRWTVRLLAMVWLPAIFITAVMARHRNDAWEESLGRVAFVLAEIGMAIVVRRALRTGGRIMTSVRGGERAGLAWRLRNLWRAALIVLPIGFAGLALAGYYYTAVVLQGRLQSTVWLCVALAVTYALVLRWMVAARRQLLLAAARAKRQAAVASTGGEAPGAEPATAAAAAATEDAILDLALVDGQTRRLMRALLGFALLLGAWVIWSDVLPAFEVLDRVTLWRHETGGTAPVALVDAAGKPLLDAAGKPELVMAPAKKAVTLINLLAALLVVAMGLTAARNVPGVLELAVLRRLPVGPAGRYATKSLARYVIVVVSIMLLFGALGVAWGDIQWLVAAVTVGLGFGMQEIFANFVAGVIVLLERPIRIGDTVTVGGVTGDVTRIRMRATTITDAGRRELLVPNKEFITGQVVNWTLSDSMLRDTLTVGVAYGSDTNKVCELLLQVARRSPTVLKEPAPIVLFTGFGDSTLNFELRIFVGSPGDFRVVRHELNLAIERAFREAGINIAFPQRDIHIRSVPPGWGGPPGASPPATAPRGAPAPE